MEDDPTWTLNCQTLSRSLQSLQKKISIIRRSTKKIVNVADINKARGKIRDTTRSANVEDVSSIQESLRIIERFMEVRPTYTMEGVQLMGDAQQALRDFQQACDMFYKTCIEVEESSRGSRAPFGLLPEEYEEDAEEEPTESQHLLSKGPSQRARYEQELHNEIMAELERETHEIAENVRDVHIIFNHIAKLAEEQGVVLHQIDGNLESAARATHSGNEQLRRANEHHNSSSYYKYAVILLLIFMVLVSLHLLAK